MVKFISMSKGAYVVAAGLRDQFRPYRVGRVLREPGAKPNFFEVVLAPRAF